MTGGWLSIFTACVILNHLFQGALSWFDAVYGVFLIPLAASFFWESKALKLFQVGVILLSGIIMLLPRDETSRTVGMVIMSFSMMFAYTYGFLATRPVVKLLVFGAVYIGLFVSSLENIGNGTMWVFMAFTIPGAIWVCSRELIEKARRLDELEKSHLKQDLIASETLLRETVDAGMVLVKEIKGKDAKDGCEE